MPTSITPRLPRFPEREAAALQLLGRLKFLPTRHIHTLVCPDLTRQGTQKFLTQLHAERLVWRAPVPAPHVPGAITATNGQSPPIAPHLYGLTPEGRAWLAQHDCETTSLLNAMPVRAWDQPEVRPGHLTHDLLVVEWCCAAIQWLRSCPVVRAVRCQLEYRTDDERGQTQQRPDALIEVALAPQTPVEPASPWFVPWHGPVPTEHQLVSWAIEVDQGTEKLVTLLGKAVRYRDLTLNGDYLRTLGVNPLPVILVPNRRRAEGIAREWLDGWPGGRGVISTHQASADSPYGVLWGGYKTLGERPARSATLWDDIGVTRAQWDSWMQAVPAPAE